jgi:hypothetical protein
MAWFKLEVLTAKAKLKLAGSIFDKDNTLGRSGVLYAEALRLNLYRSCHQEVIAKNSN